MTSRHTPVTNLPVVMKAAICGLLCTEAFFFSRALTPNIINFIVGNHIEVEGILCSIVGLLLVGCYLLSRDALSEGMLILKSWRWDIFLAFLLGVSGSLALSGIGADQYARFAHRITNTQLVTLASLPIGLGLAVLIGTLRFKYAPEPLRRKPFFVSDKEAQSAAEDMLGIADSAARFADLVVNEDSPESMAFGIDAPWGIGKSTYVNLCISHWGNKYKHRVVVYKFNPLRYEGGSSLVENFVDGLIRVIQKHAYIPEARPLLSRFSRFVNGLKTEIFGVDLEFIAGTYTLDDALDDLEFVLSRFDKKIIVVVDDLDRLSFAHIKEVLFAIKKSFTLPNITYLLSYDTENIGVLEDQQPDADKVTEFLEKFVNVKTSLFVASSTLVKYVTEDLEIALSGNSQADPVLIAKALGGLIDIYKSKEYYDYQPFVGDIRKIKRLINALLLLDLQNIDFDNSDVNKTDLINLLLIYANFPNVFRKIYDSETEERMGFFSVVGPYDSGYPTDAAQGAKTGKRDQRYKNSERYSQYIETLRPQQRFLVDMVFGASSRLGNGDQASITEEVKRSYACFNGGAGTGRNLEQYLKLIVQLAKPEKGEQHRFYANCMKEIAEGKSFEEILSRPEFRYADGEHPHAQFWRVITNSTRDLGVDGGRRAIRYILGNIQHYSFFTDTNLNVGLRDDLAVYLVKLLDSAGWSDSSGSQRDNSEAYLGEIVEWVFGEGRHSREGVVDTLFSDARGVLGLYDVLCFRLYCSADRSGSFFNLQRALSARSGPDAPTSGLATDIAKAEMREISQLVFQLFNKKYIEKGRNIFESAELLSLEDLSGKFFGYIDAEVGRGRIKEIDARIGALKSQVKGFVSYQLGSSIVAMGVPCGYYDSSGRNDQGGIKDLMNEYLFGVCFNPATERNNYGHFLDYLLIGLTSTFPTDGGRSYVPSVAEFTKVLDPNRLCSYWQANKEDVIAWESAQPDRAVYTPNYRASYRQDLGEVYKVLDELLQTRQAARNEEDLGGEPDPSGS